MGEVVQRRTTSNTTGDFKFERVPAGDYRVRFSLSGFVTTEAVVSLGSEAQKPLLVTLKVGARSEIVEVQAQSKASPGGVVGGVVGGLPSAPPPPPATVNPTASRAIVPAEQFVSRNLHEIYPRDTASYAEIAENRFRRVSEHPLSTFSVDVDTASYANVRRFLNEGRLPPTDAVRVEELINYFKYDYPAPRNGAPVSISTELAPAPWNPTHRLALVGEPSSPTTARAAASRGQRWTMNHRTPRPSTSRSPASNKSSRCSVNASSASQLIAAICCGNRPGLKRAATMPHSR